MFLGMDIYSWIAAIVIALIVTFLPITLPFKIVLAMVAMACFYFGRKYYHNHKNGGAETPSMSSAESEALASGILKALGGKDNIAKVDYCATRLRFEVHSYASVDEAAAKAAGAEGRHPPGQERLPGGHQGRCAGCVRCPAQAAVTKKLFSYANSFSDTAGNGPLRPARRYFYRKGILI